jgi:hypothetical protein
VYCIDMLEAIYIGQSVPKEIVAKLLKITSDVDHILALQGWCGDAGNKGGVGWFVKKGR